MHDTREEEGRHGNSDGDYVQLQIFLKERHMREPRMRNLGLNMRERHMRSSLPFWIWKGLIMRRRELGNLC